MVIMTLFFYVSLHFFIIIYMYTVILIAWKLLGLDRNTWNQTNVRKQTIIIR